MTEEPALIKGTLAKSAIEALDRLILTARNIVGGGGGRSPERYALEYITWVEDAERTIRHLFSSDWVWQDLHTDRFNEIRHLDEDTPRPHPLIANEASYQADRLASMSDRVSKEILSFEVPVGHTAVVPDSNVFLHYRRYNEIDWAREVESEGVRLVVPLVVIEELDEKKYSSRLGDRAREVLTALRKMRGENPPEKPVEVIRGVVNLQVLMDPPGHSRDSSRDEEILNRAEHLAGIVGPERLVVATGDHAMQLRIGGRGLRCLSMPERLRLPL